MPGHRSIAGGLALRSGSMPDRHTVRHFGRMSLSQNKNRPLMTTQCGDPSPAPISGGFPTPLDARTIA